MGSNKAPLTIKNKPIAGSVKKLKAVTKKPLSDEVGRGECINTIRKQAIILIKSIFNILLFCINNLLI